MQGHKNNNVTEKLAQQDKVMIWSTENEVNTSTDTDMKQAKDLKTTTKEVL